MAPTKPSGQLTHKQEMFVREYLKDMNATQAGIRAGFSPATADKTCPMWAGKNRDTCPERFQHVWDAVQAALEERKAAVKVSAQDILIWLKEMAEADIGEAVDENGQLKPFEDMPRGLRNLLTGFDVHEVYDDEEQRLASRTKKPRFTKKLEVIQLLGKHIGVQAFREQIEHRHKVDLAEAIQQARQQAKVKA